MRMYINMNLEKRKIIELIKLVYEGKYKGEIPKLV